MLTPIGRHPSQVIQFQEHQSVSARLKAATILLGILSAVALAAQLGLAMVILSGGSTKIRTAHQHTGYLTVAFCLVYIALSLSILLRTRADSPRQ